MTNTLKKGVKGSGKKLSNTGRGGRSNVYMALHGGGGLKKWPKTRYVVYGQPLIVTGILELCARGYALIFVGLEQPSTGLSPNNVKLRFLDFPNKK